MAEKDRAETLCEAVDIIVTKKLEGIRFDTTINCTIINADKAKEGQYQVTDGSAKFYAYSVSTDYKVNDAVYVTVPNGDFNNQKIIIGKQITNNTSPFLFTTPFDTLVDVSANLINDKLTEGYLLANHPTATEVLLWKKDFSEKEQDVAGFTRLGLQGQFRAWLNSFNCIDGDYGYKLVLHCKEEVVKSKENLYDLAIAKLTGLYSSDITDEIKSYLKNTLNLEINWDKYTSETESGLIIYHVNDIIKDLEKAKEDLSYAKYELFLASNKDMYGNPYNFESYYQQEKVFDISAIKEIKKMELYFYQKSESFIDKQGKLIPYEDMFRNPLLPNLFTKDAYICLGYDIASFNNDQATIYCLDSNTFSDHYLLEDNKKHIILKWIHEFEDGSTKAVLNTTNLDYEIRWYRYKLGAPSADEYSGVYWERVPLEDILNQKLQEAENEYLKKIDHAEQYYGPNSKYPSEEYYNSLIQDAEEEYQRKKETYPIEYNPKKYFYFSLDPDIKKESEQIKVIILFDNKIIRSNVLTFTNENPVINEATTEYLKGLNIWCKDNTYGNYFVYDPGNKLLEQYDVKQARELVALFSTKAGLTTSEQEGSILAEAESITWTFPTVSTMLTVYNIDYSIPYPNSTDPEFVVCGPKGISLDSKNVEKAFEDEQLQSIKYKVSESEEVVYDHFAKTIAITRKGDRNNADAIDPHQLYFIKKDYIQSYANNTIQCSIIKNHTSFFTSKTFYFGQAGTTGTDVTLKIYIDPADQFALTKYSNKGDTMHLKALLFDSHNKEIDPNNESEYADVTYEWSWFDYKYHENTEDIAVTIVPYTGTKTEDRQSANQIIRNKKWVQETGENISHFQDGDDVYYISKTRNEVILETNTHLDMDHLLILQCTVTGWGDYPLTTYKPIAIRDGEKYSFVDCANEVIYLTSGYPEYYKEMWRIHLENTDEDNDGYEDEYIDCYWDIFNPHEVDPKYIGTFKNGVLKPIGIYVDNVKPYGAQCFDEEENIIWTQPIVCVKNNYPSGTLNQWTGELVIDEENGYILAPAIAAGKKNDDNTFSGIMMGDWSSTGKGENPAISKQTGVYGFDEGMLSYALMEDGTAFFGRSGYGRIMFDGNKSTISNFGYRDSKAGMMIDLDDAYIAFQNDNKEQKVYISKGYMGEGNNKTVVPYFEILGKTNKLIHISDNDYYLQSNNYPGASGYGIKIDLDDNIIDIKNGKGGIKFNANNSLYVDFSSQDGTHLFHIDTANTSYYLQSQDYEESDGTPIAGVRIDLENGKISANDFIIEATGTNGGYILIRSSDGFIKSTWGNMGGFYITDHSIFLTVGTNYSSFASADQVDFKNADIYLGTYSHADQSHVAFALSDRLRFDGSAGTNGKLYIASNIYRYSNTTGAANENYFLIGVNNIKGQDTDRLQIGSPKATDYGGVSIYGSGGIYLVAQGENVNWSDNTPGVSGLQLTASAARLYGYPADQQYGIYARFA